MLSLNNMAKVHPGAQSSSSYLTSSKQETFTIWMKSLVLNGKGCTVFDSNGQIVYRVDNYRSKYCRDVYLMDFKGEVLFTIVRKGKFKLFTFWEGHKSTTRAGSDHPKRPGFQAKKAFRLNPRGFLSSYCEVLVVGLEKNQSFCYSIKTCRTRNSLCKIADKFGRPIAEVRRKQSTCGVLLGDDVLTMVVEPFIDHCLIMGFFVVHSLINSKM